MCLALNVKLLLLAARNGTLLVLAHILALKTLSSGTLPPSSLLFILSYSLSVALMLTDAFTLKAEFPLLLSHLSTALYEARLLKTIHFTGVLFYASTLSAGCFNVLF